MTQTSSLNPERAAPDIKIKMEKGKGKGEMGKEKREKVKGKRKGSMGSNTMCIYTKTQKKPKIVRVNTVWSSLYICVENAPKQKHSIHFRIRRIQL